MNTLIRWMRGVQSGLGIVAAAAALTVSLPAAAADIVVGQVAPLTGIEANQGRAYAAGLQLGLDAANKQAGIGHNFKLVKADDTGDPEMTVPAARKLIGANNPMVLAGFFGSRNVGELGRSGLLEKEAVALVGYRGVDFEPSSKQMFNVRASLADEMARITQHLATIGITRLALVHEDGEGAKANVALAERAAKQYGASYIVKVAHPAGTVRMSATVQQVATAAPQAVLLLVNSAAAAAFIEQFRTEGGTAQIIAHSAVDVVQLAKRLAEEHMKGVAIAQVMPSPYRITSRVTKDFADLVAASKGSLDVPPSYAMMEGYIAARVIVEAARRAGPAPSRQKLTAALETLEADLGGYGLNYKVNRVSGSRFVELSIINQTGRIVQ